MFKEKNYRFFYETETGIGYDKAFDTGKPVNFYVSTGDKWWKFWEYSIGIDVNINGYGAGIEIGTDTSVSIHNKHSSFEIGANALGRLYFKNAYKEGDGYAYSKYSLNAPEIAITAFALYFAPQVVAPLLSGSTVAFA